MVHDDAFAFTVTHVLFVIRLNMLRPSVNTALVSEIHKTQELDWVSLSLSPYFFLELLIFFATASTLKI